MIQSYFVFYNSNTTELNFNQTRNLKLKRKKILSHTNFYIFVNFDISGKFFNYKLLSH